MGRAVVIDVLGQDETAAEQAIDDIYEFLQPGGRVAVLIGPHGSGKTTVLDKVFAKLGGYAVRVANPLVSPITTDRFKLQIGLQPGNHADDGDDGPAIFAYLTGLLERDRSMTLIVDDAHSLHDDLWPVMAGVPGLHAPSGPGMNLIVAVQPDLLVPGKGGTAKANFHQDSVMIVKLHDPNDETLPVVDASTLAILGIDQSHASPEARVGASTNSAKASAFRRYRPLLVASAAVALVFIVALSALPFGSPAAPPADLAPATTPAAAEAASATLVPPAADVEAAPPSQAPSVPPVATVDEGLLKPALTPPLRRFPASPNQSRPGDAAMRVEFEGFLRRAGQDTSALSPAAKEALFQEYLAWRGRNGIGRPQAGTP